MSFVNEAAQVWARPRDGSVFCSRTCQAPLISSVETMTDPTKRTLSDEGLLPPDHPAHGTTNGYGNLGCRCELCREANRIAHGQYMQRVRHTGRLTEDDRIHGTSYRYDVGCRCDQCRAAHNEKSRRTKARLRAQKR